jgi:hypothetical protein
MNPYAWALTHFVSHGGHKIYKDDEQMKHSALLSHMCLHEHVIVII